MLTKKIFTERSKIMNHNHLKFGRLWILNKEPFSILSFRTEQWIGFTAQRLRHLLRVCAEYRFPKILVLPASNDDIFIQRQLVDFFSMAERGLAKKQFHFFLHVAPSKAVIFDITYNEFLLKMSILFI